MNLCLNFLIFYIKIFTLYEGQKFDPFSCSTFTKILNLIINNKIELVFPQILINKIILIF